MTDQPTRSAVLMPGPNSKSIEVEHVYLWATDGADCVEALERQRARGQEQRDVHGPRLRLC